MSRKQDLERHIRESYQLILEYEDITRQSDSPKEKARSRRAIEEQWELIKGHLTEYVPLCQHLELAMPQDIVEIAVVAGISLPSMPADAFTLYTIALRQLLGHLGNDHPRYTETLTLQARLLENTAHVRRYGDTETRRAERAQIVDALNQLAIDTLGQSFNAICELADDQTIPETLIIEKPLSSTTILQVPIEVEGHHNLPLDTHVWIFLEDIYGNYYLQNPPVRLSADKSWCASNIRPGREIRYIIVLRVGDRGHRIIQRWVKDQRWSAIDQEEIEGLEGYRELARTLIQTPGAGAPMR